MRKTIGLACALALGTLTAFPALAQQQCGPRDDVVKLLHTKYLESQRALGLIDDRSMMEIYISARGSWTMLVTNEEGMTCVLAAGEAWDEMQVKALGPAS